MVISPVFSSTPLFSLSEGATQGAGVAFGDFLKEMAKSTRETLYRGEDLSLKAAQGHADPQEVAMEMNNTVMAVRQLTTILNTAVTAYQKVIDMAV